MVAAKTVIHPITGEPSSYVKIARDLSMSKNTVRKAYLSSNAVESLRELYSVPKHKRQCYARLKKRGFEMRGKRPDISEVVNTPAGRLATHLFRDYRKACRSA